MKYQKILLYTLMALYAGAAIWLARYMKILEDRTDGLILAARSTADDVDKIVAILNEFELGS